jgi:phospholipid/cholesterol/gamma-HCH transport system ATP-binding protein
MTARGVQDISAGARSEERDQKGSPVILELEGVSKYYGDLCVLDRVSLRLDRGQTKIILGGSGSGKSTLLKILMGLEPPDEGRVRIEGKDITGLSEREMGRIRPKIGMVFQESGLFDSLSVFENVAYRLFELGVRESEIEDRVMEALGFVGLQDAIDKYPAEISGGMKRRVALARALIPGPQIMLYDEPTAGLDPVTSRRINELIIRLRDTRGVSGIFVTHRLRDAFTLATEYADWQDGELRFIQEDGTFCIANTRFVMLNAGKIIFEGPDELLRSSEDPYIQRFLR